MLSGAQSVESDVGGAAVYPLRATNSSAQRCRKFDSDSFGAWVKTQRRARSIVSAGIGLVWALDTVARNVTEAKAIRTRDIRGPSNENWTDLYKPFSTPSLAA